MSTPKELIPFLQETPTMFLNQFHDPIDLDPTEASRSLENHRIKPKLSHLLFTLYVDVRRFTPIQRHEEESISFNPHNRGHPEFIVSQRSERLRLAHQFVSG